MKFQQIGVGTIPRNPNIHICGSTGVSVNRNSEAPYKEVLNVVVVE